MENKLTIKDLIQADGLYENYIATPKNLIAFITVEALNLDLEDDYMVKNIFSGYSAYLLTIKSRGENIINISMTSQNNTENYDLYLKYKYIAVDERTDINDEAKRNIKNLIASKILNLSNQVQNNESTIKQHFMVVAQKLEGKSYEAYEKAYNEMNDKCTQMIIEMQEWLRNINREIDIRVTDNQETLKILQHFTDNKAALIS